MSLYVSRASHSSCRSKQSGRDDGKTSDQKNQKRMTELVPLALPSPALTRMTAAPMPTDFEPRSTRTRRQRALYRLYKPKDYEGQRNIRILFLHWAGERGNNNLAQVRDELAKGLGRRAKRTTCIQSGARSDGATRHAFEVYGTQKGVSTRTYNDYSKRRGCGGESGKRTRSNCPRSPAARSHTSADPRGDKKTAPAPTAEFRKKKKKNSRYTRDGAPREGDRPAELDFSKHEGTGNRGVSADGDHDPPRRRPAGETPLAYTVTPKSVRDLRTSARRSRA